MEGSVSGWHVEALVGLLAVGKVHWSADVGNWLQNAIFKADELMGR